MKPMKDGATPACVAAKENNTEALRKLLEHGADLDLPCGDQPGQSVGDILVSLAAHHNNPEALKMLLARGANVNGPKEMPTVCACLLSGSNQDNTETLRILFEHGADVNNALNDGTTPLFLAHFNF